MVPPFTLPIGGERVEGDFTWVKSGQLQNEWITNEINLF